MISGVEAQATGVANALTSNGTHTVEHTIDMMTFDDASMWLQDPVPKADRLAGRRSEGTHLACGTLWKRGKIFTCRSAT